ALLTSWYTNPGAELVKRGEVIVKPPPIIVKTPPTVVKKPPIKIQAPPPAPPLPKPIPITHDFLPMITPLEPPITVPNSLPKHIGKLAQLIIDISNFLTTNMTLAKKFVITFFSLPAIIEQKLWQIFQL